MSAPLLPEDWWRLSLADVAALAPVEIVNWSLAGACGIQVAIKREDMLHPQLGGNKFYKLAGHLADFRRSGASRLLSFGGAYSNHLYALAAAGRDLQIPTVGIIRGEKPRALSPTLSDAQACGMELVFVPRTAYRQKSDPNWLNQLNASFPNAFVIPEGAGDSLGAAGCRVWAAVAAREAPWSPDVICVATGTGGTAAGVLAAEASPAVCAFLALKGRAEEIADMETAIVTRASALSRKDPLQLPSFLLESNYSCGGYARFPVDLRRFMADFEVETGVPLDPVYTAKMFWGIAHKARAGHWRPGTRILVLHSGGLQGRRGFPTL